MHSSTTVSDLSGHRVLVPGGTGTVGEGIVRRYLGAGADVVVPSRTERRLAEFRSRLGNAATEHLHPVVHDYTTFAGAAQLVDTIKHQLGGIDDVVAPIGGWWAGKRLWEIDENDWEAAFVGLATTHMAVLRAALPQLNGAGAYTIIVGESASTPIPGSGLVSMEQAALLMMQQVVQAELDGPQRVFALVLGPVRTNLVDGDPDWVTADQIGAIASAASAAPAIEGQLIRARSQADVQQALTLFGAQSEMVVG